MPHVFERAPTGRAKCRACETRIASGELRFGESVPNPYADDGSLTTHWYHVPCAAFARPESFLEGLADHPEAVPDREGLERAARLGAAHHRLPRVRRAERAPTGRATCRHCRAPIEKDAWRIALAFYEDGRFTPSGFIHASCAPAYLETTEVIDRVRLFSPGLSDDDVMEVEAAVSQGMSR